jgi:hypothetical protein
VRQLFERGDVLHAADAASDADDDLGRTERDPAAADGLPFEDADPGVGHAEIVPHLDRRRRLVGSAWLRTALWLRQDDRRAVGLVDEAMRPAEDDAVEHATAAALADRVDRPHDRRVEGHREASGEIARRLRGVEDDRVDALNEGCERGRERSGSARQVEGRTPDHAIDDRRRGRCDGTRITAENHERGSRALRQDTGDACSVVGRDQEDVTHRVHRLPRAAGRSRRRRR